MKIDWRPPGGDITWLSVLWFIGGIILIVVANDSLMFGNGILIASIGVGLWFRQQWARKIAIALCCFGLFVKGLMFLVATGHPIKFTSLAFTSLSLWILWKWDVRAKKVAESTSTQGIAAGANAAKKPLISLVLLIREPKALSDRTLAEMASKAWGQHVASGDGNSKETTFVVGESPTFMAQCDGRFFLINNYPIPYFSNKEKLETELNELRTIKAVKEHKAWISIDILSVSNSDYPNAHKDSYVAIGKLIAELADEDCLAIVCPFAKQIVPFDISMRDGLRASDPMCAIFKMATPPVLRVDAENPRMAAAIAEARKRWPECLAAFEKRRIDQVFIIKAPISDGTNTEFMWVSISAIENEIIYGTLENDPVNVRSVKRGDRLRLPLSDMIDWVYFEEKEMMGGFTAKAIEEITGS